MAKDDARQPVSRGGPQPPKEKPGYLFHSSAFSTARYEESITCTQIRELAFQMQRDCFLSGEKELDCGLIHASEDFVPRSQRKIMC